jgi:hypothetical protein
MGTKETVLVCPILREQRGEALTVICLNGSGEGGQQIGKRQASHLVVLICRDPFWTAVITREPIMASLRETTNPVSSSWESAANWTSGAEHP